MTDRASVLQLITDALATVEGLTGVFDEQAPADQPPEALLRRNRFFSPMCLPVFPGKFIIDNQPRRRCIEQGTDPVKIIQCSLRPPALEHR